jgi:hypothetical protein
MTSGRKFFFITTGGVFFLSVMLLLVTQSRPYFGGVGPGEILGFLFILMTLRGAIYVLPLGAVIGFLLLVCGFLIGGAFNSYYFLSRQFSHFDIFAVLFSGAFAVCAIAWLRSVQRPMFVLCAALIMAVGLQAIPIFSMAFGIVLPAWLTDTDEPGLPLVSRYIGFSDNPNQLGLLLTVLPALIFATYTDAKRIYQRAFLISGFLTAMLVAGLTRSSSLFAAYLLTGALWLYLSVNGWPSLRNKFWEPQRLALSAVFLQIALVVFGIYAVFSVEKTGDADANGRFQLWLAGIKGVFAAWSIGVGPGGQSGETEPFQGVEAHNFLLDIMLQGGLLSAAGYVLLVYHAFKRSLQIRSRFLICALVAILVFQLAHYTARHPFNWLYLLLPFVFSPPLIRQASDQEKRQLQAGLTDFAQGAESGSVMKNLRQSKSHT